MPDSFPNTLTVDSNGNVSLVVPISDVLPSNPVDGQLAYYATPAAKTAGVVWVFRYDAASNFWYFVGGPPLYAATAGGGQTASLTYTTILPGGPSITVPLAGDYDVEIGCYCSTAVANHRAHMSYDVGATAAADAYSLRLLSSAGFTEASMQGKERWAGVAASTTFACVYRVNAANLGFWAQRFMRIIPFRVNPV